MKLVFFLISILISSTSYAFTVDRNTIMVEGSITQKSAGEFIRKLAKNKPGSLVNIFINSDGGDVDAAIKMITIMDKYKTNCYAIKARSAAFNLFQFCDYRKASENAKFMIHHTFVQVEKGMTVSKNELINEFASITILDGFMLGNIAKRMGVHVFHLFAILEKEKDWHLTVKDAKKFSLVDSIEGLER